MITVSMTSDFQRCIEIICNFPSIYRSGGITPVEIVSHSGYDKFFKIITTEEISKHLANTQDIIETWIRFSGDIRHTPAWGFNRKKDGKWIVFYIDSTGHTIKDFLFENKTEACAKMIKETMEEIRRHNN